MRSLHTRLFAFLALGYMLLLGGHVYSGDELMMARVTEAIVTRGELSVRPIAGFEDYARVIGPDGRQYTWYGLGLSLVAVPFYALAMAVEGIIPKSAIAVFDAPKILYYDRNDLSELVRMYAVTFVNPLVTALTAVLISLALCRSGLSQRASAIAAIVYGTTGLTPFYAKTFFSEPLAALFLTAAFVCWMKQREDETIVSKWAFFAGVATGASVLARVANTVVMVPALITMIMDKKSRRHIPIAFVGVVLPLLLLAFFNAVRFGSPFETGYSGVMYLFNGDFFEGFTGLIISPGRGVLLYAPWTILGLAGVSVAIRRDPAFAVLCGGCFLSLWLIYSPWAQWDGGWVYGPRFLLPALPLLWISGAVFVSSHWHSNKSFRLVIITLLFVSFALAVQSVQINFIDYTYAAWRTSTDIEYAVRWSWEWAPIVRYWDFPYRDFILLGRLLKGEGGIALAAFAWSLSVAWILSAVSLARGLIRNGTTTAAA